MIKLEEEESKENREMIYPEEFKLERRVSSTSSNDQVDLAKKTQINKQMDLPNFFKQSRHFFIMTDGGKPVYSRYGDEIENCGILATFSAIMTKFTHFAGTQGFAEKL